MKVKKFEDLDVWRLSINLSNEAFQIMRNGSFSKDFRLKDQFWGSVISISSNIAEGFERFNNNEFIRFLKIAKGSAGEARSQLLIARNVGHIEQLTYVKIDNDLKKISGKLSNLITYLVEARKDKKFIFHK